MYSIRDQLPGNPRTVEHVYNPPGCSTSLSVNPLVVKDNTFQELWTFKENRQNCLKLWFPSKQGAFYHQASLLY